MNSNSNAQLSRIGGSRVTLLSVTPNAYISKGNELNFSVSLFLCGESNCK